LTVYDLKPAFQNLLRPACRALAQKGVSANQVTVAAFVLSLLCGIAIWFSAAASWSLLLVPVVLFVRMALNAIDGMLAREFDMKTPLGALLNELGDVLSDIAIYLPFGLVPGMPPEPLVIGVALAIVVEMTGVLAVFIGAPRDYSGPMGKSDRAVLFGLLALLFAFGVPGGMWLLAVMWLWNALQIATMVNRARAALKQVAA